MYIKSSLQILVVDAVIPTPDRDSGSVDSAQLLESLILLGHTVLFVPLIPLRDSDKYASALIKLGVKLCDGDSPSKIAAWCLSRRDDLDVILISRVNVASACIDFFKINFPSAKIIFNTVDLHHVREQRHAELSNDPELFLKAARTKVAEMDVIRKSDITTVISQAENDYLRALMPDARVAFIPMCREYPAQVPGLNSRKNVLFVGSFAHQPNLDGLTWFINTIWPHTLNSDPNIRLKIIGSGMPDSFRDLGHLNIDGIGFVEDVTDHLLSARLSVAPLRFGAGTKGKVVASLCHGLPVIGTTTSGEGLSGSSCGIAVVDDPFIFSQLIVHIHTSTAAWSFLHQNAIQFRGVFSIQNYHTNLNNLLEQAFSHV